jgi:hypothetical protein
MRRTRSFLEKGGEKRHCEERSNEACPTVRWAIYKSRQKSEIASPDKSRSQ